MQKDKFSIRDRIKSFGFAFHGIKILFRDEHNARIHIAAAVLVCSAGLYFNIGQNEWMFIAMCIGSVISLEMINSSLENLSDHVTIKRHPKIKTVKDLAAGAVLFMALTSLVIASIIFIPKILEICSVD